VGQHRIKEGDSVICPVIQGTITARKNQGQVVFISTDGRFCKVRIRVSRSQKPQDVPFRIDQLEKNTFPDH